MQKGRWKRKEEEQGLNDPLRDSQEKKDSRGEQSAKLIVDEGTWYDAQGPRLKSLKRPLTFPTECSTELSRFRTPEIRASTRNEGRVNG